MIILEEQMELVDHLIVFFIILETWNEFIENHYKVKLNFKLDREDTFLLTKNDLLSIFPSFGII